MRKIVSYESTDGELFKDCEECAQHERTAGLVKWIEDQRIITSLEREEIAAELAAALLRDWSLVRRSKQTKGAS